MRPGARGGRLPPVKQLSLGARRPCAAAAERWWSGASGTLREAQRGSMCPGAARWLAAFGGKPASSAAVSRGRGGASGARRRPRRSRRPAPDAGSPSPARGGRKTREWGSPGLDVEVDVPGLYQSRLIIFSALAWTRRRLTTLRALQVSGKRSQISLRSITFQQEKNNSKVTTGECQCKQIAGNLKVIIVSNYNIYVRTNVCQFC